MADINSNSFVTWKSQVDCTVEMEIKSQAESMPHIKCRSSSSRYFMHTENSHTMHSTLYSELKHVHKVLLNINILFHVSSSRYPHRLQWIFRVPFGVFECALKRDECFLGRIWKKKKKKQHTSQTKRMRKRNACLLYWIINAALQRFTDCVVPGWVLHTISDLV